MKSSTSEPGLSFDQWLSHIKLILGLVQTSHLTCAESNANELKHLNRALLIYIINLMNLLLVVQLYNALDLAKKTGKIMLHPIDPIQASIVPDFRYARTQCILRLLQRKSGSKICFCIAWAPCV
jgi:hypothetical protein